MAILRPGGNDTALVFDAIREDSYAAINAGILKKFPHVEHVMFVDRKSNPPRGTMAGHEFCGNATRSLGYFLRDGKGGVITVNTSGISKPLEVVVSNEQAAVEIPILQDWSCVVDVADNTSVVHLDGITHIICPVQHRLAQKILAASTLAEQKKIMLDMVTDFGLSKKVCVGFIAVQTKGEETSMVPFVYVAKTGTFYAETACGSGAVAYAITEARQTMQSCELKIRQPSGSWLVIQVDVQNERLAKATLSGPVDILYQGSAEI